MPTTIVISTSKVRRTRITKLVTDVSKSTGLTKLAVAKDIVKAMRKPK